MNFNMSISNPIDAYSTYDNNEHGRHEERIIEVFDDLHIIAKDWTMVRRLLKVTAKVVRYGNVSEETRYYISNLTVTAKEFLHIIRSHWAIENSLHYVKDVAFLEDFNRMRTKQIPVVTSLLRSMAINLLNFNKISNITQSRKLFAWGIENLFSLKGV
jgi:predicted transposase YbfD/YdcC